MSKPGWYPDPGGHPGMFRFWDGAAWSAALSPTPTAPAPSAGIGVPNAPVESAGPDSPDGAGGPGGRSSRGWWIAGGAVAIVLVVVVAFVVRAVGNEFGDPSARPSGNATRPVCPDRDLQTPTQDATRDGRVYGGKLSYPVLPAPWSAPHLENRVPFGRNAWTQEILVDQYVSGGQTNGWVAAVLVAELNAGDGFFSPEQGSEIVVKCIVGAFYGEAKVNRNDQVNRATTVDGHDAWLVETHLTFDIPGLRTKGELAMVVIVETPGQTSSIYYASIPDTSPQYEAPARQAMADLRVDP